MKCTTPNSPRITDLQRSFVVAQPYTAESYKSFFDLPPIVTDALARDPGLRRHLPELADEYANPVTAHALARTTTAERFTLHIDGNWRGLSEPIGVVTISDDLNEDPTVTAKLRADERGRALRLGANVCFWVAPEHTPLTRQLAANVANHLGHAAFAGATWLIIAPDEGGIKDPSRSHRHYMTQRTNNQTGWLPQYGIQDNVYALYAHDADGKLLGGNLELLDGGVYTVSKPFMPLHKTNTPIV